MTVVALPTYPRLLTETFSVAFLAPISWLAALATAPKLGRLQKIFNRISRANFVISDTRNISKAWVVFNRISRPNIVTRGTRNISKRWSTSKKFSTAFLTPISITWLAAHATSPKLGRLQKNSIAFLALIQWLATHPTFPNLIRLHGLHFSRHYRDQRPSQHLQGSVDFKIFNRISRVTIVTGGTHNISKC